MVTTITRNGITVEVPDNFFEEDYVFGIKRFRRLKQKSGLTYRQFAEMHGFTYAQVVTWVHRKDNGEPKTPCPARRVDLVIIEERLRMERSRKKRNQSKET